MRPAVLLVPFILAGCASAPISPDRAAAEATCRQQADTALVTRDRSLLFQGGPTNTPYSGGGLANVPTQGLALRYERDQMIGNCLMDNGFGTRPPPAP